MNQKLCEILKRYLKFSCEEKEALFSDLDGYDSLNHILIVSDIENEYSIDFTFEEIDNLKSVKDLIELIESKKI